MKTLLREGKIKVYTKAEFEYNPQSPMLPGRSPICFQSLGPGTPHPQLPYSLGAETPPIPLTSPPLPSSSEQELIQLEMQDPVGDVFAMALDPPPDNTSENLFKRERGQFIQEYLMRAEANCRELESKLSISFENEHQGSEVQCLKAQLSAAKQAIQERDEKIIMLEKEKGMLKRETDFFRKEMFG
ncbi:hypothetical protein ABW19_dt0202068 [Dactylella cylindrospora]|nr:hypothetical protein ABW19_dt0202068 [Dactylella cylindrospora]